MIRISTMNQKSWLFQSVLETMIASVGCNDLGIGSVVFSLTCLNIIFKSYKIDR